MNDTLSGYAVVPQTCKKCDIEIHEGHAYELGDDRWHINCFKCFKCEKSLGCNSNFLVLGNGSLVCLQCLYSCKQCHKKIDDLAILTGDQAYCLSCFKCRVCKSKIEDLRYARTSKGLFCMSCHEGLIEKKKKHDLKKRQMAQLSLLLRPDDLDAPFGDNYSLRNVSLNSVRTNGNSIHSSSIHLNLNSHLNSNYNLSNLNTMSNSTSNATMSNNLPSSTSFNSVAGYPKEQPRETLQIESFPKENPFPTPNLSNPPRDYVTPPKERQPEPLREVTPKELAPKDHSREPVALKDGLPNPNLPNPTFPPLTVYDALPDDRSFGTALSTTTTQMSAPFSEDLTQIEEVNDLDDELKIRRMREKLDRRFRKLSAQADGAILDLIDSFSAPNTPSTIYNHDELSLDDKKSYFEEKEKEKESRERVGRSDSQRESGRKLEHTSPHKNLLLLSPNQFHDNDFHVAGNNTLSNNLSLSAEDVYRPRSSASSPMAKANRQARVVETNDEVSASEIATDLQDDIRTPQPRDWDRKWEETTPKKPTVSAAVTLPPPRLALPEVPSTPDQNAGLGLDLKFPELVPGSNGTNSSVSMNGTTLSSGTNVSGTNSGPFASGTNTFVSPGSGGSRRTPAVTNLEDTIQENVSRKQSVRLKISLKHKRSISGGQSNLLSKFGLFKSKDDEKGHSRTALEGSMAGTAYITPPLPLLSPMRSHARLTSDTHFGGELPADFEMRLMRFELGQLDMRRQTLLAETNKLTNEKNKLLELIRALQKRHSSEQQQHEALMLQVNHLVSERQRLIEENLKLGGVASASSSSSGHEGGAGSGTGSGTSGSGTYAGTSGTGTYGNSTSSGTYGSGPGSYGPYGYAGLSPENRNSQLFEDDENAEAASEEGEGKATRLKFWRRPKVTIGATGQPQNPGAKPAQKVPPQSAKPTPKIPASTSLHQLNSIEESGRKALNFMSKSRSGHMDGYREDLLFSTTLQARADYENEPVPLIISRCLAEVENRGFDVEGIYRLSGGSTAITAIENAFASVTLAPDRKQLARLSEVLGGDINAVTSALKRYLRKLPDPIIPFAVYENFIRIGLTKQERKQETRAEELCAEFSAKIIEKLPPANKHALYMISKHLDQVNYYSGVNRMTFKNLSVVFAPTIARDALGEREMVDIGARNEATEFLFCNYKKIFG